MGFNGLFIPLTSRGIALIDASNSLCVPHVWKKVDQINEAKDLAVCSLLLIKLFHIYVL